MNDGELGPAKQSGTRLYVPPETMKALSSRARRLWVTLERGDADVLAKFGLCAVGLVHGFAGKGNLATWDHIALEGRRVLFVCDSSTVVKKPFAALMDYLAKLLKPKGASLRIVYLPGGQGGKGSKTDVAAYLALHSVGDLTRIAAQAPVWDLDAIPNPSKLLHQIIVFIKRFVVLAPHQLVAAALWVAHTHAVAAADTTPYMAITSAEKRSGKSLLLEVFELLTARPWRVIRPTESVLFRKIDADEPTLLLDEVDTIFGDKTTMHEGIRGALNGGHRRGNKIPRTLVEKSSKKLEEFEIFGPKALAGIGKLPDTVADRSISIRLVRRAPHESVERFRYREASGEAIPLRTSLLSWALRCIAQLREARPEIPESLSDRAADGWEPLLAIADAAGGKWPLIARKTAVALHADPWAQEETHGLTLLQAIREIFKQEGSEIIPTQKLIGELVKRDSEPWGEWWGHSVSGGESRGPGYRLARLLKPYGITPRGIRVGKNVQRGFRRADFEDAFSRYLPPEKPN